MRWKLGGGYAAGEASRDTPLVVMAEKYGKDVEGMEANAGRKSQKSASAFAARPQGRE
jgi:hypothetical protein